MSSTDEIINPNENLCIPSWVNEEYFQGILTKDEPDSLAVKKFKVTAAIPPGENFTSVLLRVHMDLEMKDGSIKYKTYALKTMLDEDKGGDVINKMSLFPKEMAMYGTYLPAFENLYKAVGWNIQLAPKCLHTEKKENRINFVFEDLTARNFKNRDRLEGFDKEHMEKVLRKLAELHAASAVYAEQNGEYPEDFQMGFVDTRVGEEFYKKVYDIKARTYKKAMLEWGIENVEEYVKKFPSADQYWKSVLATLQQSSNSFNVLTHGDFWSSNIMFSYLDKEEIAEILLVDFQICKWGSPVEDLLFFLTISPQADIRLAEFDHFVAIYHARLLECLQVLGYGKDIPSLRKLHQDMYDLRNSFYAFFACFNHLPPILFPSDKDSSIKNFSSDNEVGENYRMRLYTNHRFVAAMKDLFPFFHCRGLFNFEDYVD